MSISLGGTDKIVSYLNLTKSGREASNDESDHCSVTLNFNTPFLAKQSDYLCAVTRFSVPLTQVATIKGMSFEVFHVDIDGQDDPVYGQDGTLDMQPIPSTADELICRIEIGDCFTFHQFLETIEHELENTYINSSYSHVSTIHSVNPQLIGNIALFNQGRATRLSERVKMKITPDFRFQIMICNDGFNDQIAVQLSRGMFHMCQFQTSTVDGNNQPIVNNNFVSYADRTFIGDAAFILPAPHAGHPWQFRNAANNDLGGFTNFPAVDATVYDWANLGTLVGNVGGTDIYNANGTYPGDDSVYTGQTPMIRNWTVHTAHMSCADYNRCREIVFTSDMAVKSEGNTSGSYKRFLCDYQITDATRFSYNLKDQRLYDPYGREDAHFMSRSATITETLPSHRIYQSANASAGRWQDLTLPSPLYEIEVRARVRVWDYETSTYQMEDIKLPAGTQYSVKLIFVSKKTYIDAQVSQTDRFHK